MDEQMQTKNGMSGVTVTLLILLTAVVFGGGTYAYMNNKAVKEKNDLNAQITDLQKQVATSGATATTTTPNSSTSAIDETASWKTYTSSKYGVAIKYPNDWTAKEKSVKETVEDTTSTDFVEFTQNGRAYQVEGADQAPVIIGFRASNGQTGYEIAVSKKDNETVSKATVDGVEGGKLANHVATTVYVVKSGIATSISLTNYGSDKTNAPLAQVYEKMLDTFQFTK
jgi:predicted ribosomally synthesized peptide with SipW-like signal peptide